MQVLEGLRKLKRLKRTIAANHLGYGSPDNFNDFEKHYRKGEKYWEVAKEEFEPLDEEDKGPKHLECRFENILFAQEMKVCELLGETMSSEDDSSEDEKRAPVVIPNIPGSSHEVWMPGPRNPKALVKGVPCGDGWISTRKNLHRRPDWVYVA